MPTAMNRFVYVALEPIQKLILINVPTSYELFNNKIHVFRFACVAKELLQKSWPVDTIYSVSLKLNSNLIKCVGFVYYA